MNAEGSDSPSLLLECWYKEPTLEVDAAFLGRLQKEMLMEKVQRKLGGTFRFPGDLCMQKNEFFEGRRLRIVVEVSGQSDPKQVVYVLSQVLTKVEQSFGRTFSRDFAKAFNRKKFKRDFAVDFVVIIERHRTSGNEKAPKSIVASFEMVQPAQADG